MKHFFFDMDGTITESRTTIDKEMTGLMDRLRDKADVVVVSGAQVGQVVKQIGELFQRVPVMSQNGNDTTDDHGHTMWRNELSWLQKKAVFNAIHKMVIRETLDFESIEDLVEDRGCQVSYSAIGHHAPQERKLAFDRGGAWRREMISRQNMTIVDMYHVKWAIGGTTCVDFFLKTKGENVAAFIEKMGWKSEDCVYIGDALFEGGNDASVIGVCETVPVKWPWETADFIRKSLETL